MMFKHSERITRLIQTNIATWKFFLTSLKFQYISSVRALVRYQASKLQPAQLSIPKTIAIQNTVEMLGFKFPFVLMINSSIF